MATTGQLLVEAALRKLKALGTGEAVSTAEQTLTLAELNRMLDEWAVDRLMIPTVTRLTFTLTAGLNPHTIGSAGNFNTTRPSKIPAASIVRSGLEIPIPDILSLEEWQAIGDKATTGPVASRLFYETGFPLGKVYLWPVPSEANTFVLYPWVPLAAAIAWSGSISFPPAYEVAIIYNLALRLAPDYMRDDSVSELIVATARETKAIIRALNIPVSYQRCDEAILSERSYYNINLD